MEVATMSINDVFVAEVIKSIQIKGNPPDKIEEGYFNETEWAEKLGVPKATLRPKLRIATQKGNFHLKRFRVRSGTNIKAINYFKFIK
jgi:hypothetical protein